jgi:hypothetical protein
MTVVRVFPCTHCSYCLSCPSCVILVFFDAAYSSWTTIKMDVACSSETFVPLYQSTQHFEVWWIRINKPVVNALEWNVWQSDCGR